MTVNKNYPNLEMFLVGAMSGRISEWVCLKPEIKHALATITRLEKETAGLKDFIDLMRDEFERIKSCPEVSSEIIGLCKRAITNVKQRVPVIVQRDELEKELYALRSELSKCREALKFIKNDCEVCDWTCECGHDPNMKETDLYYFAKKALESNPKELK